MTSLVTVWELAQILGLCAVAGCLILCVLAVRPRVGAAGAFALRAHELLGWSALAAAILHVGLLLGADHRVVEHVKLTAPRYEYAGILALFTLLFLTVPTGAALRRRFWPRHRNFQAAHVGAASLLVVLLAVHVVITGRYVRGRAHVAAYILLSGIALLALLRARSRRQPAPPQSHFRGGLVFGRHSRLVLAIVAGSLVALLALLHARTALALREPFLRRSEPLVLGFPHDKHRAVNCIQCHHNFVDRSGADSCISCHRSGRADIRAGAEARFHDFCLGCHRDPPAYLTGHGPVTGCQTCHAPLPDAGWRETATRTGCARLIPWPGPRHDYSLRMYPTHDFTAVLLIRIAGKFRTIASDHVERPFRVQLRWTIRSVGGAGFTQSHAAGRRPESYRKFIA